MLPHTGLFLLGKVALQMRIRRYLKNSALQKPYHVMFEPYFQVAFYR